MKKNGIVIGGVFFEQNLFNHLMTKFKDGFSHASLSIERAFEDLDNWEVKLYNLKDECANDYYNLLDKKEKKDINDYLRRFIVFYAVRLGVINSDINACKCSQKEIDEIFPQNLRYMVEEGHYVTKYDQNGNFSPQETFRKFFDFFESSYNRANAEEIAYNMQKDHMDAFDYAMSLDHIGVPEIININEKVNHSSPDKEVGFKKTNNTILGAGFNVTDKTAVPTEMQRLLAEYEDNFGMEILDYRDPSISHQERDKRLIKLFEKEALFHIKFERIHPFTDGNGRTGRIIMNKHLIDCGMAPVRITKYDTDKYKDYIARYDYEGLARMLLSSSAQCLLDWISEKKSNKKYGKTEKTNEELAELTFGDNNSKDKILSKYITENLFML